MWRGYLKFPIKDIPSGATITQADFVFYVTTVTGTPPTTHFYNCSNDWLESDDADTVLVPLPCTHLAGPLAGAGTQDITTTGLKIQDVLTQVKDAYNKGDKNFSIAMNVSAFFDTHIANPEDVSITVGNTTGGGATTNNYQFNSSKADTSLPFLNITYNTLDTTPPTCSLISVTPSDIKANSTGIFNICINCSDASGINTSRFLITKTVEGFVHPGTPNFWSIRPPENNKAESHSPDGSYPWSIPQILRADGRGDGLWYDSYDVGGSRLFTDNFTYAVNDYKSIRIDITNAPTYAILNYTWDIEPTAFRNSVFLSRGKMEKEFKKDYNIYKSHPILIKFWDLEHMKNLSNYSVCAFRNINYTATPKKPLLAFYCNDSYDPTGSTKPVDSVNCVSLNALYKTDLDKIYYTSRNSSYSKSCYSVINKKIGGIYTSDNYYIFYQSAESQAKHYIVKYANGTSGTNVSFNESKVAWTSSDDGVTWTQAEFTPDIWFSTINGGDQFQLGIYVEDLQGNNLTNFTFYTDDIGLINFPITRPAIKWYQSSGARDEELNGIHSGIMTIRVLVATDPNNVSAVNHSLYLYNTDETLNYTINSSFYSPDDGDMNITFNTSLVPDGIYKMNVTAIADDDATDIQTYLTVENFTIDNTNPLISFTNDTTANGTSSTTLDYIIMNITLTETNFANYTFILSNSTAEINRTFITSKASTRLNFTSLPDDTYTFNVTATDKAGNKNFTLTRTVTLTSAPTSAGAGASGSAEYSSSAKACGDGICQPLMGENAQTCPQDCKVSPVSQTYSLIQNWLADIGRIISPSFPWVGSLVFLAFLGLLYYILFKKRNWRDYYRRYL